MSRVLLIFERRYITKESIEITELWDTNPEIHFLFGFLIAVVSRICLSNLIRNFVQFSFL